MRTFFRGFKRSSIRKSLLFWMLGLLIPVLVIVTFRSYFSINYFTKLANDGSLFRVALALANEIEIKQDQLIITSPQSTIALMQYGRNDKIYYAVLNKKFQHLAGEKTLSLPKEIPKVGQKFFYSATFQNQKLRMVVFNYAVKTASAQTNALQPESVLVIVGETLNQRNAMQEDIVLVFIVSQIFILFLVFFAINLAVRRGLLSLEKLRNLIASRLPSDTHPLEDQQVPYELQSVVAAMNDLLVRVKGSVDEKQQFIANAAHQLKTPLAGLRLQIDHAARSHDPKEIRHALLQVGVSTKNLTRLTNQLLSLARAESTNELHDNPLNQFKPVDLVKLIQQVTAEWVPVALDKGVDLGISAELNVLNIEGNAFLLTELLNNLLDNAIRYNPSGTKVTVSIIKNVDTATLIVEDNGIGIPKEAHALVFQRFYRILGQRASGCGLGLAIVHEIARQHQATVTLDFSDPKNQRGSLVQAHFKSATFS